MRAQVEHVVMVDFPSTAVDYLHRIGRTGRLGRPGRATCLVGKRDGPLAQAIQACHGGLAIRKGESADGRWRLRSTRPRRARRLKT
jgi:superfamily II DNA/RNA helicase